MEPGVMGPGLGGAALLEFRVQVLLVQGNTARVLPVLEAGSSKPGGVVVVEGRPRRDLPGGEVLAELGVGEAVIGAHGLEVHLSDQAGPVAGGAEGVRQGPFAGLQAIGESGPGVAPTNGKLEIRPLPNGPLMVSGGVTLIAGSGRSAWRGEKVALCRCGASKNKPFCDGSHKEAGFHSD